MILQVTELSKSFSSYANHYQHFLALLGLRSPSKRTVLSDISFTVDRGEAVGLIGVNGAGKSTLLKLLAGTLMPSSGHINRYGHVGALLELGLGFNPNFSGRDNACFVAQLMGYSQSDVATQLPRIFEFSELGPAIDDPIRTYSTGMQMRLAFSVATAFAPELLIVDEALAVGDAYFQHKSFDRIRELHAMGTALLIVSHDAQAIQTLCQRAILLDSGRVVMDSRPDLVLDEYNARIAKQELNYLSQQKESDSRHGSGVANIASVQLLDEQGLVLNQVKVGQAVQWKIRYQIHQPLNNLTLGIAIRDRTGYVIFGTNSHYLDVEMPSQPGVYELTFSTKKLKLGSGSYSLSVALHGGENHLNENYDWWDRALIWDVVNVDQPVFHGVCQLDLDVFMSSEVDEV